MSNTPGKNGIAVIHTTGELEDFISRQGNTRRLAIDTEFVREKTFFPKLCLVQIATESELACIDVLEITELAPLTRLLFNPGCTKVLHAGKQDLEVLFQEFDRVPAPLFDTQIAAGLCGHGDQVGYGDLTHALCGVELAKAHARFDWTRRPLPPNVLEYAANDVRFLLELHSRLRDELRQLGRESWQEAESALLSEPDQYRQPPVQAWCRVRGISRLRDREWQRACALAEWRETKAQEENRPRQWVLRDAALLDLASKDNGDLDQVHGLPRKYKVEIKQALAQASRYQTKLRESQSAPLSAAQRGLVKEMLNFVKTRGDELNIVPSMLATRRDIERLVRGDTPASLQAGWRKQTIGDELLAMADGK